MRNKTKLLAWKQQPKQSPTITIKFHSIYTLVNHEIYQLNISKPEIEHINSHRKTKPSNPPAEGTIRRGKFRIWIFLSLFKSELTKQTFLSLWAFERAFNLPNQTIRGPLAFAHKIVHGQISWKFSRVDGMEFSCITENWKLWVKLILSSYQTITIINALGSTIPSFCGRRIT